MFRRKKPEGDEPMTENEPTPETLLAPLAKPVPPGPIATAAPATPPSRVPNMPPRPSMTELTRPVEPARAVPPSRPAEPPRLTDPVRFGEFGRPQESFRPTESLRSGESLRPSEALRSSEGPRGGEAPRLPDAARRSSEPQPRVLEPAVPPPAARQEAEIRQLIVGKEISLKGEITHCDRLLIEGSVEANLSDCRDVDIAESGLFKGSASIETAEIRGRFEGTLTVGKRLFIRATGRVAGTIRYGQIEVERGGRIAGDIEATPEPAAPAEIAPRQFG